MKVYHLRNLALSKVNRVRAHVNIRETQKILPTVKVTITKHAIYALIHVTMAFWLPQYNAEANIKHDFLHQLISWLFQVSETQVCSRNIRAPFLALIRFDIKTIVTTLLREQRNSESSSHLEVILEINNRLRTMAEDQKVNKLMSHT